MPKLSTCELIELEVKLRRRNEELLKELCEREGWEFSETGNIFDKPKKIESHTFLSGET